MDGEPSDNYDIFQAFHNGVIADAYELIARRIYVVKLKGGSVWYETPIENLNKLREKWRQDKINNAFSGRGRDNS